MSTEQQDPVVLVVDDEKDLVSLMERVLRRSGHEVVYASSGQEAVQRISEQDYDLIVLDVKMPGLSGQDVYQVIRKNRPYLAQRIIFTTGDTLSLPTNQWLRATGCTILEKPFNLNQLMSAVNHVLQRGC